MLRGLIRTVLELWAEDVDFAAFAVTRRGRASVAASPTLPKLLRQRPEAGSSLAPAFQRGEPGLVLPFGGANVIRACRRHAKYVALSGPRLRSVKVFVFLNQCTIKVAHELAPNYTEGLRNVIGELLIPTLEL